MKRILLISASLVLIASITTFGQATTNTDKKSEPQKVTVKPDTKTEATATLKQDNAKAGSTTGKASTTSTATTSDKKGQEMKAPPATTASKATSADKTQSTTSQQDKDKEKKMIPSAAPAKK